MCVLGVRGAFILQVKGVILVRDVSYFTYNLIFTREGPLDLCHGGWAYRCVRHHAPRIRDMRGGSCYL